MGRQATVTLAYADQERVYRLRIGELIELQEKCNAGPMAVLRRLLSEQWMVQDITETVRLGLIGGGCAPGEAIRIVERYVKQQPLAQSVEWAVAILVAAIMGVEDEPLEDAGKATAAETTGSSPPPSTETGPSSAGRPSRSTPVRSGSSGRPLKGIGKPTRPRARPRP